MEKTCLKCGATSVVEDSPAAECPKCGAIYAKVEAARHAADALEQSKRAELEIQRRERDERAAAKRQQQQEAAERAEAAARLAATLPKPPRRWFTPQFALAIFIGYAVLVGLPTLLLIITSMMAPKGGGLFAGIAVLSGLLMLALGAVLLECVQVIFHMASTLDDCREDLRRIADRSGAD